MGIRPKILVVGSINMDLVLPLERMPDGGETLFGETYDYIPGGKGSNQAVAAARLGADVTFCGCVGNDANGRTLTDLMRKEGINVSGISVSSDTPTGLAVIPVEKNGQNRIIVIPGANMKVAVSDLETVFLSAYDAVIMQLEIPLDIIYSALSMSKERHIPVVLDAGPAMALPLERMQGIDIISPNESETFALTGIFPSDDESTAEAARLLLEESGAKVVVLKLGKRGAFIYDGKNSALIPTFNDIKPVDTTAAGDSFTAALTLKIAEHEALEQAVIYAHAVASLCVSRKGAQPSLPTRDEADDFLARRVL